MKWILLFLATAQLAVAADSIPLAGEWRFAMDRGDVGITENWPARNLADKIQLPGVLQAQGYGNEISTNTPWVLSLYDRNWFLRADYTNYTHAGAVKVPFVSQPPRHYLGAAWYQRDVEIPADWAGKRFVLFLERPHWESRVWVDGQLIGTNNSLCAPHEFDLGAGLTPGKHTITVRVDNRMILPYRPDAHSVSDSLAQSWNGIVGKLELRATPLVWIEDVSIFPNVEKKSFRMQAVLHNLTGKSAVGKISYYLESFSSNSPLGILPSSEDFNTDGATNFLTNEFELGSSAKLWDEFSPTLYRLRINVRSVIDGKDFENNVIIPFGLRDFHAETNQFILNGRPVYLRGTHFGGDFPLTGYPPTDVASWREIFQACKDYGLNHMRFHSFCPPDAAFTAADEVGIYICIEPGMWNTFDVGSPMEAMLYAETERIIKAYGNHPSFMLFSPSNEPKGHWRDVLPKWAQYFHAIDSRRLYTSGTGFTDPDAPGPIDKIDWTTTARFGRDQIRGPSGWFAKDYLAGGVTIPVIAHELGQWDAYPDFDVIKKFTGYMRPGNYEIFRDSAATHGVLGRNKEFAKASGKFQVECYKEEIEANLRTRGLAGFQLLELHDYVGQGSAFVGVLDPFWENKGYVTPAEYRKFCNAVVPLARLKQRTFTSAETFSSDVEVANYGSMPLTNAAASWDICDLAGKAVVDGTFRPNTIPLGKNYALGTVNADLSKLAAPAEYELVVKVASYTNDWKFWVYPAQISTAGLADILTTSSWDAAAAKLAAGGKVLFLPHAADLDWTCPPLDTMPVFWDRLMNPNWGRMMGLWCDVNHPALAEFPTEVNCDWQWTQIIRGVRAVNLDKLPRGLQPIVSAVDDWNRNWKLGVVFEAKVGTGKLVVCSIDLEHSQSPVAKQFQRSLLDYMAGEKFSPITSITPAEFQSLYFDSRIMSHLGATAEASGDNASGTIDSDPNTYWSVGAPARNRDASAAVKRPHVLTISFPQPVALNGLIVMPRQNDRDHVGDVRGYEIQASDDGTNWQSVAQGEMISSFDPKTIQFSKTVTAKQLKFSSLSGFGNDPATAIAEIAVMHAGPKLSDDSGGDIHYQRVRSTSTDVDEGASPTNKP